MTTSRKGKGKRKKSSWISRLRNKYRLLIMNEETFEEKLSFRLSRLNVFVVTGTLAILLVVLTTFIIAFTPLREYIPGYTNVALEKQVYELQFKSDSLEREFRLKDQYLSSIRKILIGEEFDESQTGMVPDTARDFNDLDLSPSLEDSLFRMEYESDVKYNLYYGENMEFPGQATTVGNILFFPPLKGVITNDFDLAANHFGLDIVAREDEAVKATFDGTVVFTDWTVGTGYVIVLQHPGNYVSVYKHNAVLLKQAGDFVKAGDPIAIVGDSGELTTGPHLHFELWYNGTPIDPRSYMVF
ncbi:MAG: M23 family metallopeptidase [Bacteroidales bacterium]|nr:M23 family metallopeptidase [Bacteroidales bacterium]